MIHISCIQDVIDVSPAALADIMAKDYIKEIPLVCESVEDLEKINRLIPIITNNYTFLLTISSYLKALIRTYKRNGEKEISENMIDKSAIINNTIEALKTQYRTLSRMVTIKNMINEEIHMS